MGGHQSDAFLEIKQEVSDLGIPTRGRGGPCGPIAISLGLGIPLTGAIRIASELGGYVPGKKGTWTANALAKVGVELERVPSSQWRPGCGVQHFHAIGRKIAKKVGMGTFFVHSRSHVAVVRDGHLMDWTLRQKSKRNVVTVHRLLNEEKAREQAMSYLSGAGASVAREMPEKKKVEAKPKTKPLAYRKQDHEIKVGMHVQFRARGGDTHKGIVVSTQGKKRGRVQTETQVWMVAYQSMSILDKKTSGLKIPEGFSKGDRVTFRTRKGVDYHGIVSKINRTTTQVKIDGSGDLWRVATGYLKAA